MPIWRGGDSYEPVEGEEPTADDRLQRRAAWHVVRQDEDIVRLLSERLAVAGLSIDDLEPEQV